MGYKMIFIDSLDHIKYLLVDFSSKIWGVLTGMFLFLIGEPTMALYGVGTAMIFDIVTRIVVNAKNNGGYINATKVGKIKSKLVISGLISKMFAYFIVLSIAQLASYVVPIDYAGQAISSVIYTILFYVEVQSILENLLEMQSKGSHVEKLLNILLFKFREKTNEIAGVDVYKEEDSNENN